ncbi:metaxin-1-like [Physella acuta]|uniref:metaxin-1-like n=1 Tax=Physella acuta TaxID=109671 RepID=UPI0027DC6943|nr:metaxin-1-like [Physella acuta]
MAMEKMKLEVWRGDWGLPSIDPNCLAVLAYCKFSGVPIEIVKTGNPWRSPTGNFPILRHKNATYSRVSDIFAYLRKQNWGSDFQLTTKDSADVVAFSAMLEEKLLPALLHLWWMDDKTYIDITRPWYTKAIPFPLSLFLPARRQKKAEVRVQLTKGGDHITDAETESKVYKEAKECLNLLSYKLGDKNYMFGNQPSSLDALVFGYLIPLLKAPLPSNPLQNHLQQCTNISQLCNNILTLYFPSDIQELEEKKKQEEEKRKARGSRSDLSEFPNRRRNMILAGIFALISMFGYAVATGLIQVQITDKDSGPVGRKEMPIPTTVSHSPRYVSQNVLLEEPEEVS